MDTKIFVFLLYIEITKKKKRKKRAFSIINYQSQPYRCGFQLLSTTNLNPIVVGSS